MIQRLLRVMTRRPFHWPSCLNVDGGGHPSSLATHQNRSLQAAYSTQEKQRTRKETGGMYPFLTLLQSFQAGGKIDKIRNKEETEVGRLN